MATTYGWSPSGGTQLFSATPQTQPATSTGYQPGLISKAMTGAATGYQPATMTATGYDAATGQAKTSEANQWTVDNNQLVSGQMNALLDQNSTYLQRARTQSAQAANARGLINSSMGVQAGEAAAIDAALPIAQGDAQVHGQSAQFNAQAKNDVDARNDAAINEFGRLNMDATNRAREFSATAENEAGRFNTASTNQASEFGANAQNTMSQFNASEGNRVQMANQESTNQANRFGAEAQNQASQFNASQQNDVIRQMLDSNTKLQLADIEASYKTLMQSSDSAARVYEQAITQMSQILMNKDLDAAAKQRAIDFTVGNLRNGMNLLGSIGNLNLGGILDFSGLPIVSSGVASPTGFPASTNLNGPTTSDGSIAGTAQRLATQSTSQLHQQYLYQLDSAGNTVLKDMYLAQLQTGLPPDQAMAQADAMYGDPTYWQARIATNDWLAKSNYSTYLQQGMAPAEAYQKAQADQQRYNANLPSWDGAGGG